MTCAVLDPKEIEDCRGEVTAGDYTLFGLKVMVPLCAEHGAWFERWYREARARDRYDK